MARSIGSDHPAPSARRRRLVLRSFVAAWLALVLWCAPVTVAQSPAPTESDLRLRDAVHTGNLTRVRALLDEGVDVNATQPDGATALHWAVYLDDVETAELLIRAGVVADVANELGVTPLYLACENGNDQLAHGRAW